MNSGEIGTWIGNLITGISLVLFIIAERNKFFPQKKGSEKTPVNTNLFDVSSMDNIRGLIYNRVLIGLIFGFATSRLFSWLFWEYSKYDGLFSALSLTSANFRVMISAVFSIIIGLFFGILSFRASKNLKTGYYHWVERTLVAFIFLSILLEFYSVRLGDYGYTVFGPSPFLSMFIGTLIILLISFSLSPVEIITIIVKQIRTNLNKK